MLDTWLMVRNSDIMCFINIKKIIYCSMDFDFLINYEMKFFCLLTFLFKKVQIYYEANLFFV